MDGIKVSRNIGLLVLRKELHKVPHIGECHIELIRRLGNKPLLAFELCCHDYSSLPHVEGENLHSFNTSISDFWI